MRDGPSASCCHSAAHSASASSIVVDQPLIALQHGVEHRGVRLCAADQEEHLRVRRPAGAADLLSGRFAVIVQSAARRFYGIRLREPPENPPTAASARSRAPREPFIHTSPDHDTDQDRLLAALWLHPQTRFTTRDGFTTYNMVAAGLGISFNQRLIALIACAVRCIRRLTDQDA